MNQKVLLLRTILEQKTVTQRALAKVLGISLGSVNKLLHACLADGSLRETEQAAYIVTEAGLRFLEPFRVERALVLSAGFGSRFVPLTYETPKGLLEVLGEPMIERQLRQLQAAGITDITIMVGYLKEKFEYLQDKYGVKLLYNPEYSTKNNLATIYHAREILAGKNCYILNADNWLRENVYHRYEGGAWYCAAHTEGDTAEWVLITDRKGRITETYPGGRNCNYMYGPAYFSREFSEKFLPILGRYYQMPGTEQYYWEHVLMDILSGQAKRRLTAYFGAAEQGAHDWKLEMYMNLQPKDVVYEFENLEELRQFDSKYENDSGSKAMQLVSRVFHVPESEIRKIRCLKAGMTNNSWLFEIEGTSYICRIPGEGTEKLINRQEEKAAYEAVAPLGITDRLIYFDEASGYKISRYYEHSRNADASSEADLRCCMQLLKKLHTAGCSVTQRFDLGARISRYEALCLEAGHRQPIPFRDYPEIKRQKEALCAWLNSQKRPQVLCHIDSVTDNFIFLPGAELPNGARDLSRLRLIDWEYAAMCDPLIDVAMCAIYSFMDEASAMHLLSMYLERQPEAEEKMLFFAYMALGGLLWALWGVYKEECGVQFSDYTIRMYRYFKRYAPRVLQG